MRQPPAFQCYASDWLARESFRLASLEERGLLFTMLCHVWVNNSLPAEPESLARLLGDMPQTVSRALSERVLESFERDANGRLICPELASLKVEYLARHDERSRSGKRGAKAKWGKGKREIAEPMATPSREPMATPEKSRAEFSKGKLSKDESIEKKILLSQEHREWIDAYDNAETADAAAYRRQSRGG